jgi:hypothetical protein
MIQVADILSAGFEKVLSICYSPATRAEFTTTENELSRAEQASLCEQTRR